MSILVRRRWLCCHIRKVLRLHLGQGLLQRVTAQNLRVRWPLSDGLGDGRLEALLFPPVPNVPSNLQPMPGRARVHREMRRLNVTLARCCRRSTGWERRETSAILVLRSMSRVGQPAETSAASGASGERAFVRRLCRQHDDGDGKGERGGASGAGLCRRARRVEPHLCLYDLEPSAAKLNERASAHVRLAAIIRQLEATSC